MNTATNIFTKGMNKDIHVSLLDKSQYIHAENMRLSATDDGTSGILSALEGTKLLRDFGSDQIIGHTEMQDDLILFTVNPINANNDKIWRVVFDKTTQGTEISGTPTVLVQKAFGFSLDNPISAVSRYENEFVQKIYWAEEGNNTRFANIAPTLVDGSTNDLSLLSLDDFELVPNAKFGRITLDSIGGGSLPVGEIQYAYQYFTKSGSESLVSPSSKLYHTSTSSESLNYPAQYKGSTPEENSGKSYRLKLINLDQSFDNIRLIGVYYSSLGQVPTIKIIGEQSLNNTTLSFNDSGSNYLGELTLEEFIIAGGTVFSAKHLEDKGNYLFAADIKEENFVMDQNAFDPRTYRFESNTSEFNPRECKTYDSQGVLESTISGISPIWPTNMELDGINKYNDINNDGSDTNRYMYQSNGTTLGGEGPNVKYSFGLNYCRVAYQGTNDILATSPNQERSIKVDNGYINLSGAVSYSAPEQSAEMRSYKRDEIYRHGIVFIDKLGRESDVQWIGDIRMPAVSDINDTQTYSVSGTPKYDFTLLDSNGTMYSLYIKWEFDFSDMYANHRDTYDNLSGYRIVRVPREENDRTIVTQGLLTSYLKTYYNPNNSDAITTGDSNTWPLTRHARISNIKESVDGFTVYDGKTSYIQQDEFEFVGPEILVNKNINTSTGDRLSLVGGLYKSENPSYPRAGMSGQRVNAFSKLDTYQYTDSERFPDVTVESSAIVGVKPLKDQFSAGGSTNIFNVSIDPYDGENRDPRYLSTGGSYMTVKASNTGLPNGNCSFGGVSGASANEYYYLINYKRDNVIYGGSSYIDRLNNKYIPTTQLIDMSPTTSNPFDRGGDTFVSWFIYLRSMYENGNKEGGQVDEFVDEVNYFQNIAIPVESGINLDLRNDSHLGTYFGTAVYDKSTWGFLSDGKSDTNGYWIVDTGLVDARNESGGVVLMRETQADGIARWGEEYPTELTDLYQYNTVYSTEQTTKYFYPKAEDLLTNVDSDTRILVSGSKINGENSDSWTKFAVNDYLEVDGKHGAINNIVGFNEHLYFFQEDAIGVVSINQREVISSDNPGSLQLGTGTVLSRFDYVTTQSGTRHGKSVVVTPMGLFYYDSDRQKIYRVSGSTEPVSDLKGLHSYIAENVPNSIKFNDNTLNGYGVIGEYDSENNELLYTFIGPVSFTVIYNTILGVFTSFYSIEPKQYVAYNGKLLSIEDNTILHVHNEGEVGSLYGSIKSSSVTYAVNDNYMYAKVFDSVSFDTESTNNDVDNPIDTFDYMTVNTSYQSTGKIAITQTNSTRRDRKWSIAIPRNNGNTDRIRDKHATVTLEYDNTNNYKLNVPYISTNYRINYR